MYHGDGSYKTTEFELERSLVDLLSAEKELVDKLNANIRALELVKKSGIRQSDYIQELKNTQTKLNSARQNIRLHLEDKLYIKSNIAMELYKNKEKTFNI